MATEPASNWHRRIFWLIALAGYVSLVFIRFARQEAPGQALLDTAISAGVVAVLAAIILSVEKLFRGRARLWARIAEASAAVGLIVFSVAFRSGSTLTFILAASFWLFVTGALLLLAALRPDVTT